MANILANVMGGLNMRNLRVAETEKYAHVTYFFNGGVEQPFPGEERVMVQSPKVATYDLKPEMSAAGIADAVIKATEDGTFDVIIVNFANADMVGHSGKIEPTVKAVETVDACLGRIETAVRAKGGAMLITADHGNAEMMIDPVDRRSAHGAHHESGAVHRGRGRCEAVHAEAQRLAARYFADHAGHARDRRAEGDDGHGSAHISTEEVKSLRAHPTAESQSICALFPPWLTG